MKTITLPAGTLHLDIDDIADYMALSLWPLRDDGSPGDGLNYGFCYATLKDELAQAIEAKELPARDPLTKGLHAHPYGENVKHALVRVDDLRKYVADRGLLIEVLESEAPAQTPASPAPTVDEQVVGANGAKPLQRGTAQDDAILSAIRDLGFDPLKLPKNEAGKPGVHAAVRGKLVGVNPLFPKKGTQLKHAWERLRARKEIADQD